MKRSSARPRPCLDEVTLVAVTSVALGATVEALQACTRQVEFASVLLLSDQTPPAGLDRAVTHRPIKPLSSRADYSQFMLRDLADHVETRHALCVQWDGFVLDGEAWDPQFLDYDYVGAVWPHVRDGYRVGNGGFSLRSRRLLEACRKLPFDLSVPEDVLIGRIGRPRLEAQGLRFASEAVARKFAYERTRPSGREFGFHGAFNLARHLAPDHVLRIFQSLEPQMLARNERLDILRWALLRGRIRLAAEMLARLS